MNNKIENNETESPEGHSGNGHRYVQSALAFVATIILMLGYLGQSSHASKLLLALGFTSILTYSTLLVMRYAFSLHNKLDWYMNFSALSSFFITLFLIWENILWIRLI